MAKNRGRTANGNYQTGWDASLKLDFATPLPASIDAERAVLGAVLLSNETWYQTDKLTADDFSVEGHRIIYRAMMDLSDSGRPIDFITLCEVLRSTQELRRLSPNALPGELYVMSLTDGLPRVKNISSYVDIILEKSRKRKIIMLATNALNAAYDSESKPEQIIETFDRKLLDIQGQRKSEPKKICDILPEADRQIEQEQDTHPDREAVGYKTGVKALDRMTTGYRKREVTVIAGETSDGKSSLLRQGVIANALEGKRQLVFSREVSRQQLALDIKAYMSQVFPGHVRDPRNMFADERKRFREVNCDLAKWALWVDDSRGIHINDLFHKARKLIRIEGVEIVWIDYMQLVRGNGGNKTEQVESVCSGVWTLADSEHIPVVVLSQLNRADEGRGKKTEPTLRRLKNASQIEQDAHCLIFCFQPEDAQGNREPHKSKLIIAKQRHGPTGFIPVEFSRDSLSFIER